MELMIAQQWDGVKWENMFVFWMVWKYGGEKIQTQRKGNIYMDNEKKETAIQNEQQLNEREEIVNSIINILAKNNLSITEAKNVLYVVSKKICQQIVKSFA